MFSNVWSENTTLFERLMEIHSNPPKLYYGFNFQANKKVLFFKLTRKRGLHFQPLPPPPPPLPLEKRGLRGTIEAVSNFQADSKGGKLTDTCYAFTVETCYNEVLGTMKITLLYQVSHIRVKKPKKYKELGPAKLPCYKRVLLYQTSL